MSAKIYVGNLSFKAEESRLTDLFSPFGEVKSVKLITDRYTGQSRGFGFVEMGTEEEAQKAITELDGTMSEGRNLRVSIAHEKRAPQAAGGQGGGFNRAPGGAGGGGGFNRRGDANGNTRFQRGKRW